MVGNFVSSGNDKNFGMNGCGAYHPNGELVDTGARRLKGEIHARRSFGGREGVGQASIPNLGYEWARNNPLCAQLLDQTFAHVEPDLSILNRRGTEVYR